MRHGQLHQVKDRAEVDRHHFIPKRKRRVFDAPALENARRINQHIEPAHLLTRLRHAKLALPFVRQIGCDDKSFSALPPDSGKPLLAATNERNRRARV